MVNPQGVKKPDTLTDCPKRAKFKEGRNLGDGLHSKRHQTREAYRAVATFALAKRRQLATFATRNAASQLVAYLDALLTDVGLGPDTGHVIVFILNMFVGLFQRSESAE